MTIQAPLPPREDVPRVKSDDAERQRLVRKQMGRDFQLEAVGKFTAEQAQFLWRWIVRAVELGR